jgi:hypothetical protein
MTDKLMKCFEQLAFDGTNAGDSKLASTGSEPIAIDASGVLKDMW